MSNFATRLRELRTERKLTNISLSLELGGKISPSAISLWELGKRTPNLDAAILLAQYFNVTLDYIAGLSN